MRDKPRLLWSLIPAICLVALPLPAPAQDVDLELEKRIDAAVGRGAKWLMSLDPVKNEPWAGDLIALALVAAGTPPKDRLITSLIGPGDDFLETYYMGFRVCLRALRLKSDPTDLESFLHVASSAKFLVDTQFPVGRWGYLRRESPPRDYWSKRMSPFLSKIRRELEELRKNPARHKGTEPYLVRIPRDPVFKKFWHRKHGDFSNSQFAMLALYAATRARLKVTEKIQARIVLPEETLYRYLRVLVEDQYRDGGWSYGEHTSIPSYGSMTYAGVFGLLAVRRIAFELPKEAGDKLMRNNLNHQLKKVESSLRAALCWLKNRFTVRKNPRAGDVFPTLRGDDTAFLYYMLFSLERAATLASGYELGKSDWFKQGAEFLLEAQKKDGGWPQEKSAGGTPGEPAVSNRILSTVFAILFLKRFTSRIAPPVETPRDGKKK